jgi:hypothetical protein
VACFSVFSIGAVILAEVFYPPRLAQMLDSLRSIVRKQATERWRHRGARVFFIPAPFSVFAAGDKKKKAAFSSILIMQQDKTYQQAQAQLTTTIINKENTYGD